MRAPQPTMMYYLGAQYKRMTASNTNPSVCTTCNAPGHMADGCMVNNDTVNIQELVVECRQVTHMTLSQACQCFC